MSSTFVQNLLKKCYIDLHEDSQKSYENTYRFMYFLEQGKAYYLQADQSPLSIKPTLLFYGFIHLIKACILLTNAHYPETTSVLAHGVTARKKKKQNYSFLEDEIKTQKNGLFPHMCLKMFHMKHVEGEKWSMFQLLKEVPELDFIISRLLGDNPFLLLEHNNNNIVISNELLDNYHVGINGFVHFLSSFFKEDFDNPPPKLLNNKLFFSKPVLNGVTEQLPFRLQIENKQYYLRTEKTILQSYPEMLIHYLLLYNLSMISRYETDWWCELIKTMPNEEYPLISSFLRTTSVKGPYMVYHFICGFLG